MLDRWLKSALEEKGLSQAEAARFLTERLGRSIDRAAVNKMVHDKRKITADELFALTEFLGVPAPDPQKVHIVPLVGYVGAGAETHLFADGQGPFDEVEAPDGSNERTVAVEIRGESLGSFFDQWLVFYDDVRDPPGGDQVGKLCVAGLEDGRILVKKLARGTRPGTWTLHSQFEPPIYDARVAWAARVKTMVPR